MQVRFVLGTAGSGKTHYCQQRIVQAMADEPMGRPIWWLLPRQLTFTAERQLACESGLGAFCRARVLSLDQLAQEILAECGGNAIPEVTSLGRQMIVGHLLRRHQPELGYFGAVARYPGLAGQLANTLAELDRCGRSAAELTQLIEQLPPESGEPAAGALRTKLQDLALLAGAYERYLGQERLDQHRRLQQMLKSVHACPSLRGAMIFVDGFLDFSATERQILVALAKVAGEMHITVLLDPAIGALPQAPPLSIFARPHRAYRALLDQLQEAGVAIDEPVQLRRPRRFAAEALEHLERSRLDERTRSIEASGAVRLIEAADPRSEAEAAARLVLELVGQGYRNREIAILTRSLGQCHELLTAALREHRIPCFVDQRRKVGHHPLLQFVRSSFQIVLNRWPHAAVMALIKSGLAQMSDAEADSLENYLLLHRIHGEAWTRQEPWDWRREENLHRHEEESGEAAEAQQMDQLRRRISAPLGEFAAVLTAGATLPVRSAAAALYQLLERCGVRRQIGAWMQRADAEGNRGLRDEHEQVWLRFMDLLDQMVELLGDEAMAAEEFAAVLEAGLEDFDLGLTPPTVDEVLVGQVDRTRNPQVRAVILMGMNEGQFPKTAGEDSVFSDPERGELARRSFELDPDTRQQLLDERLLAYVAFTRAAQRLFLTRARCDGAGRATEPSPFWSVVQRLCRVPVEQAGAEHVCTPRQLATQLMRWAASGGDTTAGGTGGGWEPALYQWFATTEHPDESLQRMRRQAWAALSYRNEPAIRAPLFVSPLVSSVTRIETYAACPFQHFLRYGLKLQPRPEPEVTSLDLGSVYHQVLERLVRQMLREQGGWESVTAQAIADHAREVGRELRGELMISSARNQYLLNRVQRTVEQVVARQRAMQQVGQFRPAFAELAFGLGPAALGPWELPTPAGHVLRLTGKIDRIDLLEGGSACAVLDYKLGANRLRLDQVYHGLSLQLLTYMAVLDGQEIDGHLLEPVAAFYLQLVRGLEKREDPQQVDPASDEFHLKLQPRGIIDEQYRGAWGNLAGNDPRPAGEIGALLQHVRHLLGQIADDIIAGNIAVRPYFMGRNSPCPNCDYRSVCRFERCQNHYRFLANMKPDEVLQQIGEGQ